jgi:hypothetical protein
MNNHCSCSTLPFIIQQKSIDEIDELKNRVELIKDHNPRWMKTFKCTSCGQLWNETWHSIRQGEIPEVCKIAE